MAIGRLCHRRDLPADGNSLIESPWQTGPTNASAQDRAENPAQLLLTQYLKTFAQLPEKIQQAVTARWGDPVTDPSSATAEDFHLPVKLYGKVADRHPARPRLQHRPQGQLTTTRTWSPRTATSLSTPGCAKTSPPMPSSTTASTATWNGSRAKPSACQRECYPEAALGPLPQLYPFIVNDPGEGTQAKRRTSPSSSTTSPRPSPGPRATAPTATSEPWSTNTTRQAVSTPGVSTHLKKRNPRPHQIIRPRPGLPASPLTTKPKT